MNVVDSSGWIEYFFDSPRADLFASTIEDTANLLVPAISIFEVYKVLNHRFPPAVVNTCLDVIRRAKVLDLTDARAVAAADVARKHNLAMADAIIYSAAAEFEATLWTQNADHQGLIAVNYFEKK
jgi:toxin FitB